MKKVFTLCLYFFIVIPGRSQITFCPPGAEWRYAFDRFQHFAFISQDNIKVTYTGDSLVNSQTCKVLKHRYNLSFGDDDTLSQISLLRQNGDTVFYRNYRTQNTWQILYNFAAKAGDSWSNFYVGKNHIVTSATMIVKSTGSSFVNNMSLKKMVVDYLSSDPYKNTSFTITERFGASTFLFYHKLSESYLGNYGHAKYFLCYSDSSFGTKQFTSMPCSFANPVGFIESGNDPAPEIFPNPVTRNLNIRAKGHRPAGIRILDPYGRTILRGILNGEEVIDLGAQPPGVYFIELRDEERLLRTERIIKL